MYDDMYLQGVLDNKTQAYSNAYNIVYSEIAPIIIEWANGQLEDIFQSGSSAKRTAIRGKSDVDVFISIKSSCTSTLKEIFDSLEAKMKARGYNVRRQNVSIGTIVRGYNVDLVPSKKDSGTTNYHKLHVSKKGTWTQTNVKLQIDNVKNSRRTQFIQLAKIWRDCHRLEFPSMNIELAVIEALKGCSYQISLSDGFLRVLTYFANEIQSARLEDPGNSNNVISDDMKVTEKLTIAQYANKCIEKYIKEICWDNVIC